MNADDADGAEVGLAIGTMRGYREWDFLVGPHGQQGVLTSITSPFPWFSTEVPPATCMRKQIPFMATRETDKEIGHIAPAPVRACTCGYYAYHLPRSLGSVTMNPSGNPVFRVCGVVEASGHMIVGPYGFRAESVRVVALALCSPGRFQATVMARSRHESAMVPFDPFTTPDVIQFAVAWPDGSRTKHVARFRRMPETWLPDPLSDDQLLLQAARENLPEKARMERAWPYPVDAIEKRFGLPVYMNAAEMVKDFPPQPSDLIPKPKALQQEEALIIQAAVAGARQSITATAGMSPANVYRTGLAAGGLVPPWSWSSVWGTTNT